jgi:polyhydroxybutyrate depolymerase
MVPFTMSNCNATHPTPVLQIHGTIDPTVPYNGAAGWTESIPAVMTHWANFNNCDLPAITTAVPNTNTTDGSTVEKIVYENGDNCTQVVHFKMTGGAHTWAGSVFPLSGTNYDINASKEVWNFVSKYNLSGLIGCPALELNINEATKFEIYPNPSNGIFELRGNFGSNSTFEIYDLRGKKITSELVYESKIIDLSQLESAVYLVKIGNEMKRIQLVK